VKRPVPHLWEFFRGREESSANISTRTPCSSCPETKIAGSKGPEEDKSPGPQGGGERLGGGGGGMIARGQQESQFDAVILKKCSRSRPAKGPKGSEKRKREIITKLPASKMAPPPKEKGTGKAIITHTLAQKKFSNHSP